MEISEKIKLLRKEKHITQEQLAKMIGVERSSVGKYETGTQPSTEIITRLADCLDVSTDYLLGREETKKTPVGETPTGGKNKTIELTEKDKRDISKRLNAIIEDLGSSGEALMFDGEPLELDDESRELLIAALKNSMTVGKVIAKQKYTPKKYRKDTDHEN